VLNKKQTRTSKYAQKKSKRRKNFKICSRNVKPAQLSKNNGIFRQLATPAAILWMFIEHNTAADDQTAD
jgi:hypothetical protein